MAVHYLPPFQKTQRLTQSKNPVPNPHQLTHQNSRTKLIQSKPPPKLTQSRNPHQTHTSKLTQPSSKAPTKIPQPKDCNQTCTTKTPHQTYTIKNLAKKSVTKPPPKSSNQTGVNKIAQPNSRNKKTAPKLCNQTRVTKRFPTNMFNQNSHTKLIQPKPHQIVQFANGRNDKTIFKFLNKKFLFKKFSPGGEIHHNPVNLSVFRV